TNSYNNLKPHYTTYVHLVTHNTNGAVEREHFTTFLSHNVYQSYTRKINIIWKVMPEHATRIVIDGNTYLRANMNTCQDINMPTGG
ncbi:hypothetical protein PFISCL1PPCAC_25506, partial [Pristionchus fissidentatus]